VKSELIVSNPVEFIAWFEEKVDSGFQKAFLYEREVMYEQYRRWSDDIRKTDAQLRRIVRYLKGWGDNLRGEMPPGIILTILAAKNYKANKRDDSALRDTLVSIKKYLDNNGFKCPRPTIPNGEDLFKNYSTARKDYFKKTLENFVTSANQAINNENQREACIKWQKHLGERFPCHLAKNEIDGAKIYGASAVIGDTAKTA